jgi:uncharacterized membrane protein YphA (DoxX/SURF4 family)
MNSIKVNNKSMSIIIDIITALFIILFVYAALSKISDFEKFKVQLGRSPLILAFAGWVAWVIPIFEVIIAVILAIKRFQLFGLYASFSLMVIFSSYIVAILKFSEYIPCSCGGILENMSWTEHLIFNSGFVLLGIIGVLLYPLNDKRFIVQ